MDNPYLLAALGVAGGLLGAPFMTFLGGWMAARFGLKSKRIELETDLAKQAREQEYTALLEFRQAQQREMTNLRLEHRTLKDAHDDLERRYDGLQRDAHDLTARVEKQRTEVEKLTSEKLLLEERIRVLERDNYRLYQQIDALKGQKP